MQAIHLGVNIDHVATLRQVRRAAYPDPLLAALIAEQSGADNITLHLREDRRHIQDHDVRRMRAALQTRMNLELAATDPMVALAKEIGPQDCCLVPERREEITTEGGVDLSRPAPRLRDTIRRLEQAGIRVSLFIDPDLRTLKAAKDLGVPAIELHTGRYAHSWRSNDAALKQLQEAARYASDMGLAVHAGHGLTYLNVEPVAGIAEIEELNIGHSVVSRAIMVGMKSAVKEMRQAMNLRP